MPEDPDDAEQLSLDDAEEVALPVVEVLTGRTFLTGKSGAGKSNSASVVAEELLDRGFPLLIVDTDGEYWGLKEAYEILHVGADEECDLQVGPEHASKLADLALEENVPIILDVSGYLDADTADQLVRETASALFAKEKKLNRPFLLLVEEVHEYIPEGGGLDETGEMLIRVAKRGRKRGLGMMGISQRPADVKKDFITQCDWLLWHRLTWENDTEVVRRVVGSDYAEAVQELADGEAFLMADFLAADVQRVQVRRKRTFDAGATPDLGEFERPDLKSVGKDLVGELEEISEREGRRQDRIAQLEARIEEKNERIAELEDDLEAERQNNETVERLADKLADAAAGGEGGGEALEEIREEKNAEIRELENELKAREETVEELQRRVSELEDYERQVEQLAGLSIDEAEEAVQRLAAALDMDVDGDAEKWREKYQRAQTRIEELESSPSPSSEDLEFNPLESRDVKRLVSEVESNLDGFNETRLKMLRYYVLNGPAEVSQAYKYTGNAPSSGWKHDVNRELIEAGLVRETDDGLYDYAVEEYAREVLGDHFSDEEIGAVVDELENRVDDAIMGAVKA